MSRASRRRWASSRSKRLRRPTSFSSPKTKRTCERLYRRRRTRTPYVKDAFHRYVVHGEQRRGESGGDRAPKRRRIIGVEIAAGARHRTALPSERRSGERGPSISTRSSRNASAKPICSTASRRRIAPAELQIARAGLRRACFGRSSFITSACWSGWRAIRRIRRPRPSAGTAATANWTHLYNRDVISMPDNWEFPWYASWDLAFHMVAFAEIDP